MANNPHPLLSLKDVILSGVKRASPKEEKAFFKTHPHYGEVIDNIAYINEAKLKNEGSTGNFIGDMMFGESLHNLSKTSPYWYNVLKNAALKDNDVMRWRDDSYELVSRKPHNPHLEGELRTKEDWWNESRFDQVVGGYLLGGPDANIHTMREWDQNYKGFGTTFKNKLNQFKQALSK